MTVDDSKRQGIQEIVSGKTMSLLCITAKKRQLATFFMYSTEVLENSQIRLWEASNKVHMGS